MDGVELFGRLVLTYQELGREAVIHKLHHEWRVHYDVALWVTQAFGSWKGAADWIERSHA